MKTQLTSILAVAISAPALIASRALSSGAEFITNGADLAHDLCIKGAEKSEDFGLRYYETKSRDAAVLRAERSATGLEKEKLRYERKVRKYTKRIDQAKARLDAAIAEAQSASIIAGAVAEAEAERDYFHSSLPELAPESFEPPTPIMTKEPAPQNILTPEEPSTLAATPVADEDTIQEGFSAEPPSKRQPAEAPPAGFPGAVPAH